MERKARPESIRTETTGCRHFHCGSWAMATNFRGFYLEFQPEGIPGDYFAIRSLEDVTNQHGNLIYGQHRDLKRSGKLYSNWEIASSTPNTSSPRNSKGGVERNPGDSWSQSMG